MSTEFLKAVLPKSVVKASLVNPRSFLIYGDYKVGKSALASWLSLHKGALWLDYEDGGEALDGGKINIIKAAKAYNAERQIPETDGRALGPFSFARKLWKDLAIERPYPILIHDKIDTLERWITMLATAIYKRSTIGKNFSGTNILHDLPEGAGYGPFRERCYEIWAEIEQAAETHVFLCSVRMKSVRKEGQDFDAADLNLTGKMREVTAGLCDAPAFLFRAADGANYLSFNRSSQKEFAGCRFPRLQGRVIKLSWLDERGNLVVDWDQVMVAPTGKGPGPGANGSAGSGASASAGSSASK